MMQYLDQVDWAHWLTVAGYGAGGYLAWNTFHWFVLEDVCPLIGLFILWRYIRSNAKLKEAQAAALLKQANTPPVPKKYISRAELRRSRN